MKTAIKFSHYLSHLDNPTYFYDKIDMFIINILNARIRLYRWKS